MRAQDVPAIDLPTPDFKQHDVADRAARCPAVHLLPIRAPASFGLVKLQRLACELTHSCSRATFRQGWQRSVVYVRIGMRSYAVQSCADTATAQQSAGAWSATPDGLGIDRLCRSRHRRRRCLLSEPA